MLLFLRCRNHQRNKGYFGQALMMGTFMFLKTMEPTGQSQHSDFNVTRVFINKYHSHFGTYQRKSLRGCQQIHVWRPCSLPFQNNGLRKNLEKITAGIPADEYCRVLREDPNKPGLLYAGTERGIYVSFNDGDSWES